MRCRDARQLLAARFDGDLSQPDDAALKDHVQHCSQCRALEQQQRLLTSLFTTPVHQATTSISTARIMAAVQQQSRISRQLEDLRLQQQTRVSRLRPIGVLLAALTFLALGSVPLLVLLITFLQPDLAVKLFSLLSNGFDVLYILAQYLLVGLTLATRNTWLLSGVAFAVVVMLGMWLRLMRYPQEA